MRERVNLEMDLEAVRQFYRENPSANGFFGHSNALTLLAALEAAETALADANDRMGQMSVAMETDKRRAEAAEADAAQLRSDLKAIRRTCYFFASVIKSGEGWTTTCMNALGQVEALFSAAIFSAPPSAPERPSGRAPEPAKCPPYAEADATLEDWFECEHRVGLDRASTYLVGKIYGDKKGRFKDGATVNTMPFTTLNREQGIAKTTSGSVYKLGREAGQPSAPPRSPRVHDLKTWPQFFDPVTTGEKPFEVRRNDRDFRAGDMLRLREWEPSTKTYTGRWRDVLVSYVLDTGGALGIEEGFVVMGIRHGN